MRLTPQRPGKSLPLWMLYPPIFLAVYLLHLTLLRLPYFWDEGGYYIPAAWDFLRHGTLIPETTLRNAHPPLPSILLAAWWKLTGFTIYQTRLLMCLLTALALLAVFRIARTLVNDSVAAVVTILTAIYPVWFAQSTLAHADMFAAVGTLWALSFYFEHTAKSKPLCLLFFTLSVMAKETAIVTPAILAAHELYLYWRERKREHLVWFSWIAATVLPLICWYIYHHAKTGFTFGNPEYLRYNATANLSAKRVGLSLWHRIVHLAFHLNLFIVTLCTAAVLLLPVEPEADGSPRKAVPSTAAIAIIAIILGNWVAFSFLGGALLTRYLLPVYPLLLLVCVAEWRQRFRPWLVIAAITLGGFAVACEVNPWYPFAPEDNLAYRDMIVLQQGAIHFVAAHYKSPTVLTAWPVAANLERPELGYVKAPIHYVAIENFSAREIAKAVGKEGSYDTAILFSTKIVPPGFGAHAGDATTADAKYFDLHNDLDPSQIASQLGGIVVWRADRKGQWAAVLRFPGTIGGPAMASLRPNYNRYQ